MKKVQAMKKYSYNSTNSRIHSIVEQIVCVGQYMNGDDVYDCSQKQELKMA